MPLRANIKVNYYAALELPSDASLEDIKKQYRKLALKHHPDRGGAVEKFQAIQEAHEILEDPATKAKYDADRRKAGLIPTFGRTPPSAARPNPYAAGASQYQPPPRRAPTAAANGPSGWRPSAAGTPGGNNGADRFANFPRPAPTSKRDTDNGNNFSAWQSMHPGSKKDAANAQQPRPQPKGAFGASPHKQRPPPPPRNDTKFPSEDEIRAGMNHRPAPGNGFFDERGRAAWANFNAQYSGKPGVSRSNTTKTPKKSGFDPMSGGDEGQAGGTANYSSYRARTRSDEARAYPPPPPRQPDFAPDNTSNRFTGQQEAHHSDNGRVKTPYSSHIGQQKYTSSSSDNLQRSNSAREPSQAHSAKATPPKQRPSNGNARKPFIVDDSSDESDSAVESTATTPENAQPKTRHQDTPDNPFAARPKRTPVAPSSRTSSPFKHSSFESMASAGFGSTKADTGASDDFGTNPGSNSSSTANTAQQPTQPADKGKNTIFTFPLDKDTFAPTPGNTARASRSEENINTTFTPERWAGKFSANNVFANNVFAAPASARKPTSPTRKSSRILRSQGQSGFSSSTTAGAPFAQYAGTTANQVPPTPPSPPQDPVKFSADEWARTMKDAKWAFQPEPAKSDPSTSASSRPSSRGTRKTSVKTAGPKIPVTTPQPASAATVEDETSQSADGQADVASKHVHAQQQGAADDLMDIDMEGAPTGAANSSGPPTTEAQKKEPKFVQVDPSDLRKKTSSGQRESNGGPPLKTNLDDLASVLSQDTTGGGLSNLADVASTLPFQSKPSSTPPTQNYAPQPLTLPRLPVPPEPPTKLTKPSWHRYCEHFERYLSKFQHFDGVILDHFNARRQQAAELVARGVAELESAGAASWLTHKRAVEEDERVRMHWSIGQDKHLQAVRVFEGVRDRVRVLSDGAGLADV